MIRRVLIMFTVSCLVHTALWACGNAMYLSRDKATKHVRKAERALEKGEIATAYRLSSRYDYRMEVEALEKRLRWVHETAAMRMDPQKADVDWFKQAYEKDKDNPKHVALYAEALVLRDAPKAKALLGDLVSRDLMPDAFAFRTLARIHKMEGTQDMVAKALIECKRMTKWKKVCSLKRPLKLKLGPKRYRKSKRAQN